MDVIFPRHDPVGPAAQPLARDRIAVIADVIAAHAEDVDSQGVRRAALDSLAAAGLLGTALPAPDQRELTEVLAGCDASTWFCWAQHQTPMRILEGATAGVRATAPASLLTSYLPGLQSGSLIGAVAFAHVRRPGPPNPVATRVAGGWRFAGRLDWVTSWDIADVVMVMAQGAPPDDDALVCAYLPGGRTSDPTEGLQVLPPLDLLAMSGTHTRPVLLDEVFVPDEQVGALLDRAEWLAADAVRTSDANPAAFGVARGAIAELDHLARTREDPAMAAAADALATECLSLRARAYALADDDGPIDERRAARAASLDLATRAARAVVVARAGAAMMRGTSAERRVREAMFLLVQAQTSATRAASLDLEVRSASASP